MIASVQARFDSAALASSGFASQGVLATLFGPGVISAARRGDGAPLAPYSYARADGFGQALRSDDKTPMFPQRFETKGSGIMAAAVGQNTPGTAQAEQFDPNQVGGNSLFNQALADIYNGNFLAQSFPPLDQAGAGDQAARTLSADIADSRPNQLGALSVAVPDVQRAEPDDFRPNQIPETVLSASQMLTTNAEGELVLQRIYTA